VSDFHASVPVAVITPAFNAEATIGDTVRSVLRQSHQNFEYVIVDNRSTDATVEVALAAAGNDQRVSVEFEPQRGSGAARNRGLAMSTAPFVAFVDADDEWNPHFLSRLLLQLHQSGPQCAAAFCASEVVTPSGRTLGTHRPLPRIYDQRRLLLEGCPPGNGSALMIRRSALDRIEGFRTDIPSCVDFEAWLRMTANGDNFACVGEILVKHRLGVTNCISSNIGARISMLLSLLEEFGSGLSATERREALLYPTEVAVLHNDPRAHALLAECHPWSAPAVSSPSWRRLVRHLAGGYVQHAAHPTAHPTAHQLSTQSLSGLQSPLPCTDRR
jgi:glycosyltransferase involved in cell wall biosynthesis